MDESDLRVRLAAFTFLDELRKMSSDLFDRRELQRGFSFEGERVPLQAPNGIFKPRICNLPLSITTVPVKEGQPRPYDDAIGDDGLLRYRYPGTNRNHPDNAGLREANRRGVPLVYITRTVQPRLHQQEFRERVLEAYQRHCAICRLRHDQLLEAAHIVGDRDTLGTPTVPNGIALCSPHHAAFDAHLMAVRPDYGIEVRRDVLEESDGPMLIHGLQGFHGKPIHVPSRRPLRPGAHLLQIRYELFQRASRTA